METKSSTCPNAPPTGQAYSRPTLLVSQSRAAAMLAVAIYGVSVMREFVTSHHRKSHVVRRNRSMNWTVTWPWLIRWLITTTIRLRFNGRTSVGRSSVRLLIRAIQWRRLWGALVQLGALPFPSPPLPPPSPPPPPFPPLPKPSPSPLPRSGPQIQLGGLGERCKLPQRVLGGSGVEPQPKSSLVHFSLKIRHLYSDNNFNDFP